MNTVVKTVRQEITRYDKPENRLNYQRFFKEKLKDPSGIKTAIIRKISNQCFKEIKNRPKQEIYAYCEQLLESEDKHERVIAFEWALKIREQYARTDFKRFEIWLKKHVHHWGSCDHLCCGPIGHLVLEFPDTVSKTKKWTKSKNRWSRRAAAVSLIVPVGKQLLLDDVFQTAELLLTDDDDMVQKGYGWMLKEASNQFPHEVFEFVMKNRRLMPRTALRYAIEKLPVTMRKQAMKKDW